MIVTCNGLQADLLVDIKVNCPLYVSHDDACVASLRCFMEGFGWCILHQVKNSKLVLCNPTAPYLFAVDTISGSEGTSEP